MASYAITGTSRGIGLELVRQLAAAPVSKVRTIVAITRDDKSTALNELVKTSGQGRVVNVVIPDITSEEIVRQALPKIEKALSGKALDVLINNAGAAPFDSDGVASVKTSDMVDIYKTNVGSVQTITAAMLPLLQKGDTKKVINMSTTLGSLALSKFFAWAPATAYKTSKAAMNMLNQIYANEYAEQGFTFLLISPGWLKTDLGSQNADLPVDVGVKSVLEIIESSTPADNGTFKNVHVPDFKDDQGAVRYNGGDNPW